LDSADQASFAQLRGWAEFAHSRSCIDPAGPFSNYLANPPPRSLTLAEVRFYDR
jgi:hypothetical protein